MFRGNQPHQPHRARRKAYGMLVAISLSLLSTPPAYGAGPRIKLAREHTRPGTPFTLRVIVSSDVPLGAYTLQLKFDPSALELTSIGGGGAEFAAPPIANPDKFPTGVVRFSAFQPMRIDGPKGLCHVATLHFQPRATKGSTRVEVEAVTIADTLGSTYPPSTGRRTLRFRGP